MAPVDVEAAVLRAIAADGKIEDSGVFAERLGIPHIDLVGVLKSLISADYVVTEDIDHSRVVATADGKLFMAEGTPEARFLAHIPAGEAGVSLDVVKAAIGEELGEQGFRQAMQSKWVGIVKPAKKSEVDGDAGAPASDAAEAKPRAAKVPKESPTVVRKVGEPGDPVAELLRLVCDGRADEVSAKDLAALRRRKLTANEAWKTYVVTKGPAFLPERKRAPTELTAEALRTGSWRAEPYKAYNFEAAGKEPRGGRLHPLAKVRTAFRKIFLSMGFEEMPTNNYVESSFWNFDALFQPQQHPARDAHDTFFLTEPARTPLDTVPAAYAERVRRTHESGGYGSFGYGYAWSADEAEKNLLRTHTTAVSSRMLYRLARETAEAAAAAGPGSPAAAFRPARYFSVDRVFRNEQVDRTHLAEFHQVEGVVADYGLTLGDLIGVLRAFFERLGIKQLRFKPAYNPYTEPSMEIFSYSNELGKWIEVGNSGMFRPEMLRPMGLPEGVNVVAWGLSLERPTMILYGIDNIRDLFGHKVSLSLVNTNPLCRLGL